MAIRRLSDVENISGGSKVANYNGRDFYYDFEADNPLAWREGARLIQKNRLRDINRYSGFDESKRNIQKYFGAK